MKKSKITDSTGLFIPAGVLIGMGVGFVVDQLVGGLFIGLGIGFFFMAVFTVGLSCSKKKE